MRKISMILTAISIMANAIVVNAAPVPRESAPCNATEEKNCRCRKSYRQYFGRSAERLRICGCKGKSQMSLYLMLGLAVIQAVMPMESLLI